MSHYQEYGWCFSCQVWRPLRTVWLLRLCEKCEAELRKALEGK